MVQIVNGEIWDRADFGTLCEWYQLYRCVEVGVDRGEFSQTFLQRCYNCTLFLGVDPYTQYPEMPWNREADFQAACIRYERYSRVAKLLRVTSEEAVAAIKATESQWYQGPYDYVYVDGAHRKEDVANDIRLWWPLLSERGVLAGHDWSMTSGDHPGVREAVTEFAEENNLVIHITELDDPKSWYVFKDGKSRTRENRGV